ncbi:MAG: hypothetical protein L0241_02210 [Planctomycetia bacterium]|nr:hypothetical protein [Planctomycetia bacterium]
MPAPEDPIPPPMPPRPPTGDATPEARLIRKVRQICVRIIQGKAAVSRWQVKAQRGLRITSIILSSLGSAGVIADKVTGETTGWAFVGAVIAIGFGILLQIANEFHVEQIAGDSRSLAEACGLVEVQLGIILEAENPTRAVAQLHDEINTVILKYHKVLPAAPPASEVDRLVKLLVEPNRPDWRLPEQQRKRRDKPPTGGEKP